MRSHNPYVSCIRHNGYDLDAETNLEGALAAADCVVVADHSVYNWDDVVKRARLLVDTRNATVRPGEMAQR